MTEPYYADATVTVHAGDCLDVLRAMPDASVDAVVTDPPYGLEFMGKEWDAPWAQGTNVNADAGFSDVAMSDGFKRLPRPSFTGSTNPVCLNCGGKQRGRKDDTAIVRACAPCDAPRFPNVRAVEMRAFGDWCELWATECLRVLKPGGHLLAFGGTRTWHRLACAVEDAGFEVRDSLAWIHGQGFPKNLNVSAALDAKRCRCSMGESDYADGAVREMRDGSSPRAEQDQAAGAGLLHVQLPVEGARGDHRGESSRLDRPEADAGLRLSESSMEGRGDVPPREGQLRGAEVRPLSTGVPADGEGGRLHHGAPAGDGSVGRPAATAAGSGEPHQPRPERQPAGEPGAVPVERGSQAWGGWPVCERCSQPVIPDGLGTAAKPAFEPVVVARKPLAGTVAGNVLAHGTGALNIDGCRIGRDEDDRHEYGRGRHLPHANTTASLGQFAEVTPYEPHAAGRWPANVVLDEQAARELDQQSGEASYNPAGVFGKEREDSPGNTIYGSLKQPGKDVFGYGDTGGASRFFYTAKAATDERVRVNGVAHPTVKPLALMRWLVRLVTPPGGTVLEPFAGSGTTVEACILEGFRCVAIEREPDYLPLIVQRINRRRDPVAAVRDAGDDGGLFDLLDTEPA